MAFNWDDENNNDTFRDMPDEVNDPQGSYVPMINPSTGHIQQNLPVRGPITASVVDQHDQEFLDAILEDPEADLESVLADANLRIELATLYKLIMNHDLFDGMDVDQRAVDTVHKEIRRFARERLEIMLGMRQEVAKSTVVSSPFNDLEVDILKKLASAASKGATQSPEANKTAQVLKQPRKEGLNTIGVQKVQKPNVVAPVKKPAQLVTKAQAPVQRQAKPATTPISDDNYKPIGKPLHELTSEEIVQRNKEASERQASRKPAKSTTSLPMPSPDQEAMFQEHRVLQSNHPLASPNAVSAIVAALNKSKSQ